MLKFEDGGAITPHHDAAVGHSGLL